MKQPNTSFYQTVVGVWLTLSVASVVLAAFTWVQLSKKLAGARSAEAIHFSAERVLRLMVDCETGARGFILTGETNFLEPFQIGEISLTSEMGHLVDLTRPDPSVLKRVIDLRGEIDVALNRLHRIMDVRQARGMQAAADIVSDGKGKAMMDRIRALSAEIAGTRSDIVAEGGAGERAQVMRASLTSLIAGILGIGAGVFAFWLSRVMLEHRIRLGGYTT